MIDPSAYMTRIAYLSQDHIPGENPDPARFANTLYDFARPAAEALPRTKRRARSYADAREPLDQPEPKPLRSHRSVQTREPLPDDLADQIFNLKVRMSEQLGKQYPSEVSDLSLADLRSYRRKGHAYFAEFSNNFLENSALDKNQAKLNAISYDNVANWTELNEELLRDNIDCMICYKMIFIHEGLISTNPTIAFTCASCASTLICSACKMKIPSCPMCKKGSLVHLNSMLLAEIRKMKFRCPFQSLDPIQMPIRCSEKEGMTPRGLFQHLSRECQNRDRFNHYSIQIRDLQLCRYFCDEQGLNTELVLEFLPEAADQTRAFKKFDCKKCINDHHSTGALMRRQCSRHFRSLTFPDARFRIKAETFRPQLEALKCYLCKALPTIPRICNHCQTCVLCLQCARDNSIRYDQCPECSHTYPSFVTLPLNMKTILNQVEVQCQKCVDLYIVSKRSSSVSFQDVDPQRKTSKEDQMLKTLRTGVEPEEIQRKVAWMPYSEYLGHLKNCSACPSCYYFCQKCSANIRYSDQECHMQGEACIQLEGISINLEDGVPNPNEVQMPQKLTWQLYFRKVKFLTQVYSTPDIDFDPSFNYKLFFWALFLEIAEQIYFLNIIDSGLQIIRTNDDGDLPPNWSSSLTRLLFQVCFFGCYGLILVIQILLVVFVSCGPRFRVANPTSFLSKPGVILSVPIILTQSWLFLIFAGGVLFRFDGQIANNYCRFRSLCFSVRYGLSTVYFLMIFPMLMVNSYDEELGEMKMSHTEQGHLFLLLLYVSYTIIPVLSYLVFS